MNELSIIVLTNNDDAYSNSNNDYLFSNGKDLINVIKSCDSKYVSFLKDTDDMVEEYFDIVHKKVKEEFDCCFVNYSVDYNYKNELKMLVNPDELKNNKPYLGEYIWSFIFNREKLLEMLEYSDLENFNNHVNEVFVNTTAIGDVIYYHVPNSEKLVTDFCYVDVKKTEHHKNIIYFANGCNGVFNGYISWARNVGRCFSNDYDITFLYDNLPDVTYNNFSTFFNCVKRETSVNYTCDRFFVVYTEYYYPKNIFTLDENYLFIHGNMSDYPNSRRFYDDIYTKYIAVSKVAAERAVGYFPTDKIEHILNPFKLDKKMLVPHLRLVSAHRYAEVKGPHRVEMLASVLDELEIPYTWNVFTDQYEGTNKSGLIYRSRVVNPYPYIQDSDFFVLLSDSEACPYSIVEALSLNVKVIGTPVDAFFELGLVDGENGYIIPFEEFYPENREKLKERVKMIYKETEKRINYTYTEDYYAGYRDLFI